jgi:hypothetical protein
LFKTAGNRGTEHALPLLTQCVLGDPSDLQYAQALLDVLHKTHQYDRNRLLLASRGPQPTHAALEEAEREHEWEKVLRLGISLIIENPWDIPVLRRLATASREVGSDCELIYLRAALAADSWDPDTNAQCARALAARGQRGQAIACAIRANEGRK